MNDDITNRLGVIPVNKLMLSLGIPNLCGDIYCSGICYQGQ